MLETSELYRMKLLNGDEQARLKMSCWTNRENGNGSNVFAGTVIRRQIRPNVVFFNINIKRKERQLHAIPDFV